MFVRASSGSGGGGGTSYKLLDIPALSAGNTYETEVYVDTYNVHLYAALVCPSSNNVYVYGGIFEIENMAAYKLVSNNGQQVKLIVRNGKLAVNTSIATAAGMVLVVEA